MKAKIPRGDPYENRIDRAAVSLLAGFGIHRKLILETRNMGFLCNGKTFNETITHNNLGGRKYTY